MPRELLFARRFMGADGGTNPETDHFACHRSRARRDEI